MPARNSRCSLGVELHKIVFAATLRNHVDGGDASVQKRRRPFELVFNMADALFLCPAFLERSGR